jgi:hypothetical protein
LLGRARARAIASAGEWAACVVPAWFEEEEAWVLLFLFLKILIKLNLVKFVLK